MLGDTLEKQQRVAQSLPEIAGVNISEGWIRLGENLAAYERVLVQFAVSKKEAIQVIRDAFSTGDRQKTWRLIHALKGVAGNISATLLYQYLIDLECEMLDQRLGSDYVERLLEQSEVELQRIIGSVNVQLISHQEENEQLAKKQAASAISPLPMDTLKQYLDSLLGLLHSYDAKASDYLNELMCQLDDSALKQQLIQISPDIERYQFDHAIEKLEKLRENIR